jgi:PTH1 family peptidyl-tRNA hydrolase
MKFKADDEEIILVKPQTYMNLSGESVIPLMQYYKIEPSKLIVVHDEIDLPFARMKIQKNRGAGGHNGLKSINEQ